MLSTYAQSLPPDSKARYELKLELVGLQTCPYALPSRIWKNDPSVWPLVHYGDVYNYLIDTPGE